MMRGNEYVKGKGGIVYSTEYLSVCDIDNLKNNVELISPLKRLKQILNMTEEQKNYIDTIEVYILQRQNSVKHSYVVIDNAIAEIAIKQEQISLMERFIELDNKNIEDSKKALDNWKKENEL